MLKYWNVITDLRKIKEKANTISQPAGGGVLHEQRQSFPPDTVSTV